MSVFVFLHETYQARVIFGINLSEALKYIRLLIVFNKITFEQEELWLSRFTIDNIYNYKSAESADH